MGAQDVCEIGETRELQLMPSVNDQRVRRIISELAYLAPTPMDRITMLEHCVRQIWALVPEEDEALFFDNIQLVETKLARWRQAEARRRSRKTQWK